MTRRMKDFLQRAAKAEPGKGILVERWDKMIAPKACNDGYGWMITSPLKIFIIDKRGRKAIASCP